MCPQAQLDLDDFSLLLLSQLILGCDKLAAKTNNIVIHSQRGDLFSVEYSFEKTGID